MVNDPNGKLEASNGSSAADQPRNSADSAATNGAGANKDMEIGGQRCSFIYQVLVGYVVEVKTKDGATYEGIFSSMQDDKALLLRMARLVRDNSGEAPRSTPHEITKTVAGDDWIEINAKDVRMGASDVGVMGAADDVGGFGTDSFISRGRGGAQGRELQRWTPDIDDSHLMHLEESVSGHQRGWDQFALNEKKFGVRTDYHEELYTTALDPTKSKISVAEAERLATEIERGNKMDTTNIHLLEERGIEIDDGDMDEEDRYGAVIREVPPGGIPVPRPAPPPPPRPAGAWGRGAPTAPIAIDARKEANKVRAQMTGSTSGGKATSPYGTPKQLASPLIGDAQKLAALNLEPGVPKVDEATLREFNAFKAQQKGGAVPTKPSVIEFKEFSQSMEQKLHKQASGEKSAAVAAAEKAAETPAEAAKKTSSLNPNAKTFSLNVGAKEFTPSFGSKPAATPPPAAVPAAAPIAAVPSAPRPIIPPTVSPPGPATRPGGFRPDGGAEMGGGGGDGAHFRKREGGEGGYNDYRGSRDRRQHHDMRPSPPYGDGGAGGGHPPPPPPHGRSPPTGGMHMGAMPGAPMMAMGAVPPVMYFPVQMGPRPGMAYTMPGPGGVTYMAVPGGNPAMMRPMMMPGVPMMMPGSGFPQGGPGGGGPRGGGNADMD